MRRSSEVLIISLLCIGARAQQGGQLASVSGVVVNSETGDPILRAHVTLRPTGEVQQVYGAMTDAGGKFAILRVPPGSYMASAERIGHLPGGAEQKIKLEAGAEKSDVKISLTPAGSITGRVVDADGEPMEGVSVTIVSGAAGMGTTDDRGQYRVSDLAPGRYRVVATPQQRDMFLQDVYTPEIRSAEAHYAATYYPNSLEARSAGRVLVKAGVESNGIDIRLVRTPVVHVSGVVSGFPKGAKNLMVRLDGTNGGNKVTGVKADGKFRIGPVDPGRYYVVGTWGVGAEQMQTAPVEVEVAQSDVENVELRAAERFTLSGVIRYDDEQAKPSASQMRGWVGPPGSAPRSGRPQILLQSTGASIGGAPVAAVNEDGTFEFQKVLPGKYRVVLMWRNAYVKFIQLGSTLMEQQILDLTNGGGGNTVSVSVSSAFAEISGKVEGPADAAQRSVVVAKADPPDGMQVHYGTINADGSYRLSGLAPGKYHLGVVAKGGFNPSEEIDDAVEVTVGAGEKVSKDLKVAEGQ